MCSTTPRSDRFLCGLEQSRLSSDVCKELFSPANLPCRCITTFWYPLHDRAEKLFTNLRLINFFPPILLIRDAIMDESPEKIEAATEAALEAGDRFMAAETHHPSTDADSSPEHDISPHKAAVGAVGDTTKAEISEVIHESPVEPAAIDIQILREAYSASLIITFLVSLSLP